MDKPPLSSFEGAVPSPKQYLPTKTSRGRDGIDGADGRNGAKGEKGERGDKGERGEKGEKGDVGERGPAGRDGKNGKDGKNGERGSADTAEDIVKKLTTAKTKLPRELVEGLEEKFEELMANMRRRGRGGDNILMGGSGLLAILANGTGKARVAQINFGTGLTVTPTGDGTSVDVTASGGGGFTLMVPTGTVDGSNTTFVFTSAPSLIALDNGNLMNKVSSDGTVNWTGTTTVVLTQAPNANIYGF